MCLRRAPEKYITGGMAPVGVALDRAVLDPGFNARLEKYTISRRSETVICTLNNPCIVLCLWP
jgi:hypothetical protein